MEKDSLRRIKSPRSAVQWDGAKQSAMPLRATTGATHGNERKRGLSGEFPVLVECQQAELTELFEL